MLVISKKVILSIKSKHMANLNKSVVFINKIKTYGKSKQKCGIINNINTDWR